MEKNVIKIALKGAKKEIVLLILCSAMFSYLTLQIAVWVRYAIDGILDGNITIIPYSIQQILRENPMENLMIIASIIIFICFVIMIVDYQRGIITAKVKLRVNHNIKFKLYQHVLCLEYKSYRDTDKSEILQRLTEDSEICADFFEGQFNLLLDILFFSVFVITQSIRVNWIITLYLIITIAILLLFSIWYLKKLNHNLEETIQKSKNLLGMAIRSISHSRLIRMFHKQKEEIENYQKLNEEYTEESIKLINLMLFYEIVSDHITYLKSPIIYVIGGIFVIQGKMTIRTS